MGVMFQPRLGHHQALI